MDLREQQDLIARAVMNFPPLAARSHDESGLEDVDPEQLAIFSESLFRKRLHEVAKLLPLTRRVTGRSFAEDFRRFHSTLNPKTVKRHVEDGIAFCAYIARTHSDRKEISVAADFEATKLSFFISKKRFAFCRPAVGPDANASRRWLSFALWLRIGNRVRFFSR